jgi:enoyl-CoA hydratase
MAETRRADTGSAEGASDEVLYEVRDRTARVTLNRPGKVNALNRATLVGLSDALHQAAADDEVRVVVLTGAGGNFSAGYDLVGSAVAGAPDSAGAHSYLDFEVEVTMNLWSLPKPTIAAVDGWCLAAGCELAMACDMVVATEEARFGEPEIRYGSGPVTLLMPFVLGAKKTSELLFTGATIGAHEAAEIGLVNRVVAGGALDGAVEELVAGIIPTPLPVLKFTKLALIRAQEAMGLRSAVTANLDLSAILNKAETDEGAEFQRIVAGEGLKAALRWRDARYGAGV